MTGSRLWLTALISLLVFRVAAQDLAGTYVYACNQKSAGNFDLAVKAFDRVMFFDTAFVFPGTVVDLGECCYLKGDFKKAYYYYNLALNSAETDSARAELTIRKISVNLRSGENEYALIDLYTFQGETTSDQKRTLDMLEGIINFNLGRYTESRNSFLRCSMVNGINRDADIIKAFGEVERLGKKYNPRKARTLSMLMPGSGQLVSGNVTNGINSFLLVFGLAAAGALLGQDLLWIDSTVIVLPWLQRYYTGGYKNAYSQASEKLQYEKSRVLASLVQTLTP